MTPLHLEAIVMLGEAKSSALLRQLETHIFHTCRLDLSGNLPTSLERIMSSSPALESLSLCHTPDLFSHLDPIIIPTLFNVTAPKLTPLELIGCDISWKAPLLKGLRTLKILRPSDVARPTLVERLERNGPT